MLGHRMSSLPIAQFCPKSPGLSQVGSGRAAAVSSAVHALWAGDDRAPSMLARLTDEEQAEIGNWTRPTDVVVGTQVLRYADAVKEIEVAIDARGEYVSAGSPYALSVGHIDFVWILTLADGRRIAYVADLKRSEWTTLDGPRSLQLVAYGIAIASRELCDAFVCGIWSLSDSSWEWGDMIECDSERFRQLSQRVVAAALNTAGDYGMGNHCTGCYGRLRCPAYLLPPSQAVSELSPFAEGGVPITGENAAYVLLLAKRAADTADAAIDAVKAAAKQGLKVLDNERGMQYRAVACKGKMGLDKEELQKLLGDTAIPMKRGAGYDQYRWVKQ